MKKAVYFSFLISVLLLAISFIAYMLDLNFYNLLLPLGIGILLLISLPLFLIHKNDRSKISRSRLKEQQNAKKTGKASTKKTVDKKTVNYPSFGKRKSGLTWGGGNIHASTAKRGTKRGFLER